VAAAARRTASVVRAALGSSRTIFSGCRTGAACGATGGPRAEDEAAAAANRRARRGGRPNACADATASFLLRAAGAGRDWSHRSSSAARPQVAPPQVGLGGVRASSALTQAISPRSAVGLRQDPLAGRRLCAETRCLGLLGHVPLSRRISRVARPRKRCRL
jgi:hypothetical protein